MKKILLSICVLALCAACQQRLTSYVNPFVGTDGHGHTYPGAIVPFGMIQPGPDTRQGGWDGCSGYHYSDDTIYGFSHTHLSGTGCEDYGDVLLMPFADQDFPADSIRHEDYLSTFFHQDEEAHPGYYAVKLQRNGVKVELTCNERFACHHYTFPKGGKHGFVIDLNHRDRLIAGKIETVENPQYTSSQPAAHESQLIVGFRESNAWNPDQHCYFAIQAPYESIAYRANGTQAIVWLPEEVDACDVYVAISGTDQQGALANLNAASHESFEMMRHQADSIWESALSKVEIKGASKEQRRVFYTALYHCFTAPYLWSDVDGRYRGMDQNVHQAPEGKNIYTVFSLWDTYRTLNPLLTLLEPQRTQDFVYTFLQQFRQGGELTMWELASHETHCMIGYHAVPVILEAYRAGLVPDSIQRPLLEAMVATSNRTEAHRSYAAEGYLCADIDNESVSKTLEYAYDDWCIAQYAKALGDDSLYVLYSRRAQSYQNVFEGFMHPRRNGAFITPFDPTEVNNHFTEANSWQYSSYVPHDVCHWIEMQGGKEAAERFLDTLFESKNALSGRNQADITGLIGIYAHGNEPSHHAAYLYAFLGKPEKSNALVHKVLNELYTSQPDGLCGNEDCGQMSAWYVMSALGFYPVCPGSGEYVTVEPLFKEAIIHRDGGTDLVIRKSDFPVGKFWHPGADWSMKAEHFLDATQVSIADSLRMLPAPKFSRWEQRFEGKDTLEITMPAFAQSDNLRIYYTLDGSLPDTNAMLYQQPIELASDQTVRSIAYSSALGYSPEMRHVATRFVADRRLSYITKPDPQYYEEGEQGLIDHIYASTNFRIGGWQGWTGDMQVVIDLLTAKPVHTVGVDCLESMRAWIFYPASVEVETSLDGERYVAFGKTTNTQFPPEKQRQEEQNRNLFQVKGNAQARYVRVTVHNFGKMPTWHTSAGEQAWLFVDEVVCE